MEPGAHDPILLEPAVANLKRGWCDMEIYRNFSAGCNNISPSFSDCNFAFKLDVILTAILLL